MSERFQQNISLNESTTYETNSKPLPRFDPILAPIGLCIRIRLDAVLRVCLVLGLLLAPNRQRI